MKTRALQVGLFVVVMTGAGCGEKLRPDTPRLAGPSSLAPLLAPRLEGVWGGQLALTGIAGGTGPARSAGYLACIGDAFTAVVGEANEHNLSISQAEDGTVTAKLSSATTGLSCDYAGRIGNNTLVLSSTSCDQHEDLDFRCAPGGPVGQLQIVGSTITAVFDAPVSVTRLTGTAAHTYNVGEGAVVANHEFLSLTRR